MKSLTSIFLVFFSTILFVGNIGVNVFKHICSEDGVTISYLVNSNNHCAEEEVEEEVHACCESKEKKDDCCNDEVAYVNLQLDIEFSELTDFSFPTYNFVEIGHLFPIEYSIFRGETFFSSLNPPPLELRRRLSQIQVYQI